MRRLVLSFLFCGLAMASIKEKPRNDRSRTEAHCGVPQFTERLPDAPKSRVYDIWEHYEDGDDCERERADTKKVLETLPAELRRRVLAPRGPAFLKGASPVVWKQFEELWKNKTIPRAEKPEKFKELALQLLNPIQMKEFEKWYKLMEERRAEFTRKLANLSPEARAAHEKLTQLREQRQKIVAELGPSAKNELSQLYRTGEIDRVD